MIISFNIFLEHKKLGGIIAETMDTTKIFDKNYIMICKCFKKLIIGKSELDFLDFIVTYNIGSRRLLVALMHFFRMHFKRLLFPFFFKFEVFPGFKVKNTFKNRLRIKLIQLILNLYLIIM